MTSVRKTSSIGPAAVYGDVRPWAMANTLHAVLEVDEVRAERVAALRAQIQNGTYFPDPRKIAKKLLEHGL
jgi:flagellar biosynthesis anti-sigma factor FlgM